MKRACVNSILWYSSEDMRKVLLCQFSLDAGTVESEGGSRHIKHDSLGTGPSQDTPWTALKQQQQPWYCKNILQTTTQRVQIHLRQRNTTSPVQNQNHTSKTTQQLAVVQSKTTKTKYVLEVQFVIL